MSYVTKTTRRDRINRILATIPDDVGRLPDGEIDEEETHNSANGFSNDGNPGDITKVSETVVSIQPFSVTTWTIKSD